MKILTAVFFLFLIVQVKSQEIGIVKNGNHSLRLVQENALFSLSYTDVLSKSTIPTENYFQFSIKESVFNILINGFENKRSNQIILKTPDDIIVKLNYQYIKGEKYVYFKQYSLVNSQTGTSALFKKEDIKSLFQIDKIKG